jgi:hypothetical protein
MAILADTGATVLVTANALRLLRHGRSAQRRPDDELLCGADNQPPHVEAVTDSEKSLVSG